MKTIKGLSKRARTMAILIDGFCDERDLEFLLALMEPGWTSLEDFLLKRKEQGLWIPPYYEA